MKDILNALPYIAITPYFHVLFAFFAPILRQQKVAMFLPSELSQGESLLFIVRAVIIIFFVFILFSLGSALYFLVHDKGNSDRIVKALTWRIGLSFLLFILLFIAFALGWISPHPI